MSTDTQTNGSLPLEQRLIFDMPFGYNKVPSAPTSMLSHTWEPNQEQIDEQEWVRAYLKKCECTVAHDIELLGCTGLAACDPSADVAAIIENGTRLRLGLAGSGVGLPCFVPPSRFCLVHNTIGGLEPRQAQEHAQYVEPISRPLTPEEEARAKTMQQLEMPRRLGELNDIVTGKAPLTLDDAPLQDTAPVVASPPVAWKCPEHTSTVWGCRHCLAQAIVEGPLDPTLVLSSGMKSLYGEAVAGVPVSGGPEQVLGVRYTGADVDAGLQQADEHSADVAELFVQVATFSRKLSRD